MSRPKWMRHLRTFRFNRDGTELASNARTGRAWTARFTIQSKPRNDKAAALQRYADAMGLSTEAARIRVVNQATIIQRNPNRTGN